MVTKVNLYQKDSNAVHYTYDALFCSVTGKQIATGYEIESNDITTIVCQKEFIPTFEKMFNTNKDLCSIKVKYIISSAMPTIKTKKVERGKMSLSLRYETLKRDNFKCVSCGAKASDTEIEIDHITPVSKGGKTVINNLQALCFQCNRGKSNK